MSSSPFLDNLKQLFSECDTDKNGSLGRVEFHELCNKIGLNGDAAEETFARLDSDRDGRITFNEFAAGFNQYQSKQTSQPAGLHRLRSASSSKLSALARQKNAGQMGVMSLSSSGSSSSSSGTGSSLGVRTGANSTSPLRANDTGHSTGTLELPSNSLQQDSAGNSLSGTPTMLLSSYADGPDRSVVYDSESFQSAGQFSSLVGSDSSLSQVKTFQDLVECIQKLQTENQILSQTFFKDKREREEYISQLGEEFDLQVREVEERANRRARLELEAEKKRLREMMQAERETLQHHYQTIERMSKLVKQNASAEQDRDPLSADNELNNIIKVKSKLEDTALENRKLKKSLLDTKSDVAMIQKEMEKLKRQYELKLSSAHELNDETRSECDHIKQQLDLMKDSNRKLQDASDVITSYIADKIEPVIKGALDDPNHLLAPNATGNLSNGSHSPAGSRKGSVLSQYLLNNFDQDDASASEPASLDTTDLLKSPAASSETNSQPMSRAATVANIAKLDHNQDAQREDLAKPIAQEKTSPKECSQSKASPFSHFFSANRTLSNAKLNKTTLARDPTNELRNLRAAASVDQITDILIEPADGPSRAIFNIILVGDSFVGKSSFATRFMEGQFVQGLISNCSIDFKTKAYKIDGTNYTVNLWDTAGQERFRSITASYFRKADGIILMYDVTDKRSYLNVRNWMSTIADTATENVAVLLVGNKIDLRQADNESECVPAREGVRLAAEYKIVFLETSVKTGIGLIPAMAKLIRLIANNNQPQEEDKDRIRLNDKSKMFNCMPKNC